VHARSVEVPVSVSTGGSGVDARSAEAASASMGGSAASARSVQVAASASTVEPAIDARSAEAAASVSTGGHAISATERVLRHQHLPAWTTPQMQGVLWEQYL